MEKPIKYVSAELELVQIDIADVITTSPQLGESDYDYGGWTKPKAKSVPSIEDWS